MNQGMAIAKAYGGEPVVVTVIAVSGKAATIQRDARHGSYLMRDLFRYDEQLLHQLRQAHLQGDSAALERLWNRAEQYVEAKTA